MARYGRHYKDKDISTSKIAQQERDDFLEDMNALLHRRLFMNRLEVEVAEVFKRCVPDHIANALDVLEADPFWCTGINRTTVTNWARVLLAPQTLSPGGEITGDGKPFASIQFAATDSVPAVYYRYCDSRVVYRDIPEYPLLLDYCRNQHRASMENQYASAAIRDFVKECNTWGQTVRIWPAFTNYIIHEGKRARVESQSKNSPLPVRMRDDPKQLACMVKRLNFTEQVLVQALMLPKVEKRYSPSWHYEIDYWADDVVLTAP